MLLRAALSLFLLTSVGCVVETFDLAGDPNEDPIAFSYDGTNFLGLGYLHLPEDRDVWVLDLLQARGGGAHTLAVSAPPFSEGSVELCFQGWGPEQNPVEGCSSGPIICQPDGTQCRAAVQVLADPKVGVNSLVLLFDMMAAPKTAYGFLVSSTYE